MAGIFDKPSGSVSRKPSLKAEDLPLAVEYGMSFEEAVQKSGLKPLQVGELLDSYRAKRHAEVVTLNAEKDSAQTISPEHADRALGIVDRVYSIIEATLDKTLDQLQDPTGSGMLAQSHLDPRDAQAAKGWATVASSVLGDHPGLLSVSLGEQTVGELAEDIDARLSEAFGS